MHQGRPIFGQGTVTHGNVNNLTNDICLNMNWKNILESNTILSGTFILLDNVFQGVRSRPMQARANRKTISLRITWLRKTKNCLVEKTQELPPVLSCFEMQISLEKSSIH